MVSVDSTNAHDRHRHTDLFKFFYPNSPLRWIARPSALAKPPQAKKRRRVDQWPPSISGRVRRDERPVVPAFYANFYDTVVKRLKRIKTARSNSPPPPPSPVDHRRWSNFRNPSPLSGHFRLSRTYLKMTCVCLIKANYPCGTADSFADVGRRPLMWHYKKRRPPATTVGKISLNISQRSISASKPCAVSFDGFQQIWSLSGLGEELTCSNHEE